MALLTDHCHNCTIRPGPAVLPRAGRTACGDLFGAAEVVHIDEGIAPLPHHSPSTASKRTRWASQPQLGRTKLLEP